MRPIRLSIALVTRNRPNWLRRCLESWRSQEVQPAEILVSDDSDDSEQSETRQIAEQFEARWIAGPWRGLYANRNNAFRSAMGTHVMSADDDHTHPLGFVEAVISAIDSDPAAIWTVSERSPNNPDAPLLEPGELRSNGTVGPPENTKHSAAIACGSTVYPREVFDMGLRCDETYDFGGLWYLWGHHLRKAGFRIRHCPNTFVWHHTESSISRASNVPWLEDQLECNLYVQAVHALQISHRPVAVFRAMYGAARLLILGGEVQGHRRQVRLGIRQVVRAFSNSLRSNHNKHP